MANGFYPIIFISIYSYSNQRGAIISLGYTEPNAASQQSIIIQNISPKCSVLSPFIPAELASITSHVSMLTDNVSGFFIGQESSSKSQ